MNGAYWHIATNHIPVIALMTIFVWKTGGPAAQVIRGLPEIQRADIHEHAQAADFGLWAAEIVGALSLIGLWLGRGGNLSSRWGIFVLIVALWASTVEARVAHLGGLIRHSEIRAVPISETPK